MPIRAKCPKCATSLNVPREMAGRRGRCPKCSASITVPKLTSGKPTLSKRSAAKASGASAKKRTASAGVAQDSQEAAIAQKLARHRRRLVNGFESEIKPAGLRIGYMLGTLLVTLVMLILPLLYVALIVAASYGVYYHCVNHTMVLSWGLGRARIFALLLYVCPIVVGVILVFFMTKPLLARPAHEGRIRSLTPKGEPDLFAFVRRLCQVVGAPEPKRIDIDFQLNASARFRRGLLSMLGSDLVLTIGVPLVAGLSISQFAGVMAHEFGHFSQGTGMRLTYIVRSINGWFARVVYERDEWDVWLEETTNDIDFRIGWMLLLAQIGVMLSRAVLWVLMVIGHIVSGFMLRQMEYDADRYETRVAGSDTFESTTRRLQVLGAANAVAQKQVIEMLNQQKLPDNLTKVMLHTLKQMPDHTKRKIDQSIADGKTGWLDTHPCDADRIASARREQAPGVFHGEGSATLLFHHFEAMTRNVTWDLYCSLFGSGIKPEQLQPVESLLQPAVAPNRPRPAAAQTAPIPIDDGPIPLEDGPS